MTGFVEFSAFDDDRPGSRKVLIAVQDIRTVRAMYLNGTHYTAIDVYGPMQVILVAESYDQVIEAMRLTND